MVPQRSQNSLKEVSMFKEIDKKVSNGQQKKYAYFLNNLFPKWLKWINDVNVSMCSRINWGSHFNKLVVQKKNDFQLKIESSQQSLLLFTKWYPWACWLLATISLILDTPSLYILMIYVGIIISFLQQQQSSIKGKIHIV